MADNAMIAEAEYLAEEQYDANDPEQVNKARIKAGRRRKKAIGVVGALMQHADGREWIYMLLSNCEVYRLSYVKGEDDRDITFREGKRYIGLQLLSDVRKASLDNYALMLKECDDKGINPLFPTSGLD